MPIRRHMASTVPVMFYWGRISLQEKTGKTASIAFPRRKSRLPLVKVGAGFAPHLSEAFDFSDQEIIKL